MNQRDLRRIDDLIKNNRGQITITETASASGLSVDTVKDALNELIKKYVCRLAVTENGDLIYDFGQPPVRKDRKTPREYLAEIGSVILKVLAILYRIAIAVVLVVYFVLFLAILVVIVIAALSKGSEKNSERSDSSSSFSMSDSGFMWIFLRMFLDLFTWHTITGSYYYTQDDRGYRYRHAEPKKSRLKSNKKSFVASVYDFVFGPPRLAADPLTNEKEVAQFLRENKGLVVAADLMALAGWTAGKAQEFFTDCLVRFQGEVKVSENGVVYGEFDQIIRGDFGLKDGKVIYYWNEYEPEHELTGNGETTNLLITCLNAFNLVFSFLVVTDQLEKIITSSIAGRNQDTIYSLLNWFSNLLYADHSFLVMCLGWFPLVFSVIFFAIPIIRWIRIEKAREKRHRNNILKRFYYIILHANRGNPMTINQVEAEFRAIEKKERNLNYKRKQNPEAKKIVEKKDPLPQKQIETIMNDLALDLQGDTVISETTGEIVYLFPRIQTELSEIADMRRRKKVDGYLGKVIAESLPV